MDELQIGKEVRKKLFLYLQGSIELRAFWRWFSPATWPVDRNSIGWVHDLVYGIKLRVAEYTNGHWTEQELKEKLKPLNNVRGE